MALVDVPAAVAEVAEAALQTRAQREGGGTARGIVAATALATGHVTMAELLEIRAWHRSHPEEVREGRSTLLAGLYGGAPCRSWLNAALAAANNPTGRGAMVALPVDPESAKALAVDDGEPPDAMHLTLFHIAGDASELEARQDDYVEAVRKAVESLEVPPVLTLTHVERFSPTEDEDLEPVAAVSDTPDVYAFRQALEVALEGAGLPYSDDHAFRAHVTLGYWPPGDGPETGPLDAPVVLTPSSVEVHWAGNVDPVPIRAAICDPPELLEPGWYVFLDGSPVSGPWENPDVAEADVEPGETKAYIGNLEAVVAAPTKQRDRRRRSRLRRFDAEVRRIDRHLAVQLHGAVTQAYREAIRRGGVKLKQKARSRPQRAALEAANGIATPAVLAAIGAEAQDLVAHSFDSLGDQAELMFREAQQRKLQAAARILAPDPNIDPGLVGDWDEDTLEDRYGQEIDRRAAAAAAVLVAGVGFLAMRALTRGEDTGEVPYGTLRAPLTVLHGGSLPEVSLDVLNEDLPAFMTLLADPGIDRLIEDIVGSREPNTTRSGTWTHGAIGLPKTPFEPHVELDGETVYGYAQQDVTAKDPSDFPGGSHYWPGDHDYCTCAIEWDHELAGEETEGEALAEAASARARVAGEGAGHAFRGNQYVSGEAGGGEGPNPEQARALLTELDNGLDTPEKVERALEVLGAEKIEFPDQPRGADDVYVYHGEDASYVIEWDGESDYSTVTDAYDWVGGINDPTDYFPDYDQQWNDDFWSQPQDLFHGTDEENVDGIMRDGLDMRSETRGLSNRFEGPAVYTSTEPDELDSYGTGLIRIDTAAMKADGFTPFVNQEPDVIEYELKGAIASRIGLEGDTPFEIEGGMSPYTVVVNEAIPAKYLEPVGATASARVAAVARVLARARIARVTAPARLAGEGGGHPFRGNQYVSGESGGDSSTDDRGGVTHYVEQLYKGEKVSIPADQVATLVDELGRRANEAKERGEDAPPVNLCDVTIEGSNLFCSDSFGIPRQDMPQLVGGAQSFRDELEARGIGIEKDVVPAQILKATQSELDGAKVANMAVAMETGRFENDERTIFVSKENYVLDGHHRWAGSVAVEYNDGVANADMTIPVERVDLPILDLVELARAHGETRAFGAALARIRGRENLHRARVAYSEDQPRDDHGRWTSDGGGDSSSSERPTFAGSVVEPVHFLAAGKVLYNKAHDLPPPSDRDWSTVMSDPDLGGKIADDYERMPEYDSAAEPAYDRLAEEVDDQYDFLTTALGVDVEFLDHDPYENVEQLKADLEENGHLGVLSTDQTPPGHPYLTDEQNDRFRAVHDAFGHAAIGRSFDRNGEEAAFQSHAEMFSRDALPALASETRGQNNALIYGGYGARGEFPPQKFGLLPPEDYHVDERRTSESYQLREGMGMLGALPRSSGPDDDNLYDVTGSHHVSLGRSFDKSDRAPRARTAGEGGGHPFRGNQYVSGEAGGDGITEEDRNYRDVNPMHQAKFEGRMWGAGERGMEPTLDHPRYFYHLTKSSNRESILEHGLEAGRTHHGDPILGPRVHLALDEWKDPSPNRDVWRVDTQGIPIRPDPGVPEKWGITARDIPPDRLELVSSGPQRARAAALDRVIERARVAGEGGGHPFRGNQYVAGEGGGDDSSSSSREPDVTVRGDPSLYGTAVIDLPHDMRQPSGAPIRGKEVISPEDDRIPDEVYHVTTAADAIREDGMLDARGAGGLGGDQHDEIVSFTIDRDIAEGLADDLKLTTEAINAQADGPPPELKFDDETKSYNDEERLAYTQGLRDVLSARAEADGWKFELVSAQDNYSASDILMQYFVNRPDELGRPNPILFGDLEAAYRGKDPDQVSIITVPKENLNTGAMVTDFDLGQHSLEEIRVYGDVPVTGAKYAALARVAGEGGGHPFRGNQYVSGEGGSEQSPEDRAGGDKALARQFRMRDEEQRDRAISAAANVWSGDNMATDAIQYAADVQLTGEEPYGPVRPTEEANARAMLEGVRHGDENSVDLWRGVRAENPVYEVGQSVKFSLGSFSENRDHAEIFAAPHPYTTSRDPVLFRIEPGNAQTLDMNKYVDRSKGWEREHVTGGTFEVTSVGQETIRETSSNEAQAMVVTLRQSELP